MTTLFTNLQWTSPLAAGSNPRTFTAKILPRVAYTVVSYQTCDGVSDGGATYGACPSGTYVWSVVGATTTASA